MKAILIITSDKCYENTELGVPCHEEMALGGYDPYSSIKPVLKLYHRPILNHFSPKKKSVLQLLKLSSVIGGGDWSKNRLIPDAVTALSQNKPFVVRNPTAIRPWQFVLEPLAGYLCDTCQKLAEYSPEFSEAWNFGPKSTDEVSVQHLC